MGKTHTAKELLEKIELAELREYPEELRDEAQKLLLSRHLAVLGALRKAARRTREKMRP